MPLTKIPDAALLEHLLQKGNLENLDLTDCDKLVLLKLKGMSFKGSKLIGAKITPEDRPENRIDLNGTNWTEVVVATTGRGLWLNHASLHNAKFGYQETLAERAKRYGDANERIPQHDAGSFMGADFTDSDFTRASFSNIDFGGDEDGENGYGAIVGMGKYENAAFRGCNMSHLNFSSSVMKGVKIIDPVSLRGMVILANDVDEVAAGITLSNPQLKEEFRAKLAEVGSRAALEQCFQIEVLGS